MSLKHWIQAARLRTLPLAAASASCGCLLAEIEGKGNWQISCLTILTAVMLQIFSNFANDYGDALNGADADRRHAPPRMVSGGLIGAAAMRRMLVLMAAACCLCGSALLATALPQSDASWGSWLLWLLLGTAALAAAYGYTAGKKPYGYIGLGDAAVFVFFGWLAVGGGAFLHTGRLNPTDLLPASALGCWCVMVLNLNNMRDIRSDKRAGKYTLAVRLGRQKAGCYHAALALAAWSAWLVWLLQTWPFQKASAYALIFGVVTFIHLNCLKKSPSCQMLDKLLPQWSLCVLLQTVSLWLAV